MNDQILAVSVEARINKLEREMRKASAIVGRNFDGMEKRSKRATADIERHFAGIGDRIGGIGKNLAAGFIGGLVAGGITGIAAKFADVAKSVAQIGDEAKRAGLGITEFQELKYVAEQNRVGVDGLVDGIKELNLRADEFIITGKGSAAEAFTRLGYNAETLKEKLKNPSALFTEIIGKLGDLDRAAQIRIADEIFGGTGGEKFVQLIEEGEAALNRTRQEAHDLGLVMDDELIAKAGDLDRAFQSVASTVGNNLQRAIVNASWALFDFMQQFKAFEDRTSSSLEARMDGLSREIVTKDHERMQSLSDARSDPGKAGLHTGFAVQLEQEIADLRADEANILKILQDRAKPVEMPSSSVPPLKVVVDGANTIDPPARSGGGGGGGRASEMRDERDAAAELIAEFENELRVIGMSAVEKQVDAALRKAGASATDAQKQSIRELVMAIETEGAAMDQMQTAMDSAKGMAKDFLGGLLGDLRDGVDGATALANAFSNLASKLMDMALDSLINSLFSNLMGGTGGGGLLGGLFGFAGGGAVEAATGGHIRGPGTGTSDSIPARLSDGEFVVRASQTAKHLDLLHAINRGELTAFATGGLVGDGPAIRAANDNIGHANDNAAPVVTINAPVTVNASGGTPEQNSDLAKRMRREMEAGLRGIVADEIRQQRRSGNLLRSRGS
jgi:hypothetical protein